VPAPVGAGLAFLPMYLWLYTGNERFAEPVVVRHGCSPSFSDDFPACRPELGKLRPRRRVRLEK